MPNTANSKLKLLYILEYFKAKSDENTPVTSGEIIEYLNKKGLVAERKSVHKRAQRLRL